MGLYHDDTPEGDDISGSDTVDVNVEEEAIKSFRALINDNSGSITKVGGKEVYTYAPTPAPPPPSALRSLTSPGPKASGAREVKVPLLGTLPLDGGLLLVAPAAAIGVLGVLTGLYIAVNSRDDLATSLKSAELFPTKTETTRGARKCRGLCYDQKEDLEQKAERIRERGALEIFF
ncbi:hypothetical protein TrRE_jg1295 [Triparma retinervis]|uniref:Uncharacterized protein n=1 Tax=Triparma retinervis TaxID=2557542 RepID=A0A9W6ZLM7_9STRA|nr:hypothetical protein TrRE_jg1295 [Triparma retinervis]